MFERFDMAIIGMGPAGIGAAMSLRGSQLIKKTICLESGLSISADNCSVLSNGECCESNNCYIISGVGGSSKLSSGKMSDYPAGSGLVTFFESEDNLKYFISDVVKDLESKIGLKKVEIDEKLISQSEKFYKKYNIQYKYYDVYEFDGNEYRSYLETNINSLLSEGLTIKTSANVLKIAFDKNTKEYAISVDIEGSNQVYFCRQVIMATGNIKPSNHLISTQTEDCINSCEIGVRVEGHSDVFRNCLDSHGDLKLKYKTGRTYCVSQRGKVIFYQLDRMNFLEGSVDSKQQTQFTNLSVLIKFDNELSLSDFFDRYKKLYGGVPIKQKYVDYMEGTFNINDCETTLSIAQNGDISKLFPENVNILLREFLYMIFEKSMDLDVNSLVLIAPELKLMSNVVLSQHFEKQHDFYIVGAASGKFRGILQCLCSGMKCGQNILGGE